MLFKGWPGEKFCSSLTHIVLRAFVYYENSENLLINPERICKDIFGGVSESNGGENSSECSRGIPSEILRNCL